MPGGPPHNVILISPSSTFIRVNWDLPDPLVRNGIIAKHQLNYTEVTQSLNWTTVLLNGSTSYLIKGLKNFTRYYVSVSAGTQISGFGSFSDPKFIRTCMLNFNSTWLCNPCELCCGSIESILLGHLYQFTYKHP